MKRVIISALTFIVFLPAANAQNNVILEAMKDELARSIKELKLETEPGPYFISYLINDSFNLRIQANSGAVVSNSGSRVRLLRVDARVGDYDRDNYNFSSLTNSTGHPRQIQIITDDDYDAIRRAIWLETDSAYKAAVDTLNRKNATLRNTTQTDRPPDFSKGGAARSIAEANDISVPGARWEERVSQIAGLFLRDGNIERSNVDLFIRVANTYVVNSDGAETLEPAAITQLRITASARAEDGMPLDNYRVYTVVRAEDLPDQKTIETDVRALISELVAARTAPIGDEYNGPVLFEGESAGELFVQGFVNYLKGTRTSDVDNPQLAGLINQSANPFISRINTRVAANFLSIKDTPSLKRYQGKDLPGVYDVDSEGIPAQDVSLVENGILKNLLMSRTPVKGIEASNGHGRGRTVVPGVLHVTSENRKSSGQLRQDLIEAVKDEGLKYGYIIRGLVPTGESGGANEIIQLLLGQAQGQSEPSQFRLSKPYSIFRLYADGREEPVRGLEFGVISMNALRSVLATSEDETVYCFPGAGMGNASTVITPSLLINGIDLRKSTGNYPKPPEVDSPIGNRKLF